MALLRNSDTYQSTVVISGHFPKSDDSANDIPAADLAPGTRLGTYLIIDKLGDGGMGEVYRAEDTILHRTVALKILTPNLCQSPHHMQRLQTEAEAQARLQHPNITTLYSMHEFEAGKILVMEYVEGQTLEQRIKGQGPLGPKEAVIFFGQALNGLHHSHSRGVIHRDLKPSNIYITRNNQIKLIDFGVARIIDPRSHADSNSMVGTLLYMAPEQINGGNTDARSDVYTMGVSLFEAVTGRLPFERRTDYALMHAHVQEKPPTPRQFERNVPKPLEWIILRAIEKDPNRRFQNAQEFRYALFRSGLLERRGEELHFSNAQLKSDSGGRKKRFWMGLAFDALLIATIASIIYALGLYPSSGTDKQLAKPTIKKTIKYKKYRAKRVRSYAKHKRDLRVRKLRARKAKAIITIPPKKKSVKKVKKDIWAGDEDWGD